VHIQSRSTPNAALGVHHIVRLHITMNDPLGMGSRVLRQFP
jgi:hypothetical protein